MSTCTLAVCAAVHDLSYMHVHYIIVYRCSFIRIYCLMLTECTMVQVSISAGLTINLAKGGLE